jgi:Tfp pilus assembly protein PilO
MSKLPKEKRDKLILVGMGTLVVLVLIGFGLISPQYATISVINAKANDARNHLQDMEDIIKTADKKQADLADLTYTLSHAESDLASGDSAQWIYNTIRNFKGKYKVDVAVNGQLTMGDVDMLPKFPYKQLKVTVSGTAYYHDLGQFIADFENNFPHARIANLNLEPAGGVGDSSEKLAFRMDIIALTNPTGPQG